jgi:riboflavin kinase/FMN adenylyltransferase
LSIAAQKKACATVVTFEPHPQFILNPEREIKLRLLTTQDEKIDIFKKLKIDRLIILPFTRTLAEFSSEEFVEKVLVQKIGFQSIIVGYDHAFGKRRSGNYLVLKDLQEKHNYSILQMNPFSVNGAIVSSTKIRKLIASGEVASAAIFLGRLYRLKGKVIRGEGRGKKFAIPTANLSILSDKKLIPQNGIYAGWTLRGNQRVKSMIYIGYKPTFHYDLLSIEIHLLAFNGNLYDETMEIEFTQKIRDDITFESAESLYHQIEKDKAETLKILSKN